MPGQGIKLTLSVRNAKALQANFRAFDRQLQADVREEVKESGEFCKELTQFLSPVDTGFMRDHVTTVYGEGGYSFETGWFAQDFYDAGHAFLYPIVQEFGSVNQPAQPSLGPAYAEIRPVFERNIRDLVRNSAARGLGR